ncbi:MAG TPA: hypothetical protein VEP49_15925 [Acidimicrobiia bacterium]|nr:hypothetical protein [Acidimicrobiia bacterium]
MKTKLGVFSLSASSPDGTDDRYLAWHHLDHLPQQYEVTGVLFGQRWVSTPDCRAARVAASDRFDPVNHVVHYLFGEPVAQSVDEFFTLRDHLIEIGRFPERLPNRLVYGGEPVEVHAAPSASVTADVLPYRPNRGLHLVIERSEPPGDAARWSPEHVDALLGIDGVAGMWSFAPTTLRPDEFSRSGYCVAAIYLEEEPTRVAGAVNAVLADRWSESSLTPALAAPFEALLPFDYARHARPG